MKTKINSIDELRKEKNRLKLELIRSEEALQEDFALLKEELKPLRLAGRAVSYAMINKNDGVVNDGVRFAINGLLKNVVLAKAGWITKLVVPFIVKNISSNMLLEKKPEVLGYLRNLIHKARKATHASDHYDKSTVDEMNY
jgi:hypothetical protein